MITVFYRYSRRTPLSPSKYVSKLFLSTTVRIVIIIVFLGLLAYSVYLITTIKQGIMPEDAVPEDSFLTAYLGKARVHFKEKIAELDVVFYNTTFYRSTRRVSSSLGGSPTESGERDDHRAEERVVHPSPVRKPVGAVRLVP